MGAGLQETRGISVPAEDWTWCRVHTCPGVPLPPPATGDATRALVASSTSALVVVSTVSHCEEQVAPWARCRAPLAGRSKARCGLARKRHSRAFEAFFADVS